MNIPHVKARQGIALIIVMVAVFVLSALIGAFALAMKVETKLAMTAVRSSAALWEGLSGVEAAKSILVEQLKCRYDSLDQKWAGGPGGECDTNSFLAEVDLTSFPIDDNPEGKTVSIKITDLDRKININTVDETLLQQALTVMGVDGSEIPGITSSILDWIDQGDAIRINGTESDYYESLEPSYSAKNMPIDDISELLWIKGITPEMYSSEFSQPTVQNDPAGRPGFEYNAHLKDMFTPISRGKVNINTAPASVLAVFFNGDMTIAERVVSLRAETPAGSPVCPTVRELLLNAGLAAPMAQQMEQRFSFRSTAFEVEVEVKGSPRKYVAILGRTSAQDIRILSFHWKDFSAGNREDLQ